MLELRLKEGAPDEPDTGDWDAICSTPGPSAFFAALFREVAHFALPEPVITSDDESKDSVRHIRTGWSGSPALGAEITQMDCPETTDFPVFCIYETYGLPGMKVKWEYALEYAGQLGHVAFRHRNLECTFDSAEEQERFTEIWRRIIGKTPVFEQR